MRGLWLWGVLPTPKLGISTFPGPGPDRYQCQGAKKDSSDVEEDTRLKEVIRKAPKGPALSLAGTFGSRTGENGVLARCWGALSKDGRHNWRCSRRWHLGLETMAR